VQREAVVDDLGQTQLHPKRQIRHTRPQFGHGGDQHVHQSRRVQLASGADQFVRVALLAALLLLLLLVVVVLVVVVVVLVVVVAAFEELFIRQCFQRTEEIADRGQPQQRHSGSFTLEVYVDKSNRGEIF
jgi:fatty acid desaturase